MTIKQENIMTDINNTDSQKTPPNSEPLRVLLIGSPRAIALTIRTLANLGFANINDWSPLSVEPNTGKMMSSFTRYLPLE